MAEPIKGLLHKLESLSSDPEYSCKISCSGAFPELEKDR